MTKILVNNNKDKWNKVKTSLIASALLSFTLFLLAPSLVYFHNQLEFTYSYTKILPYLLAVSVLFTCLLTPLLYFPGRSTHQRAVAITTAIGFLIWLQGNVLAWDYGSMDGRSVDWSQFMWNGVVDSLLWIGVLVLAVLLHRQVYRWTTTVGLMLLIVQFGGVGFSWMNSVPEPSWKDFYVDYSERFLYSRQSNVIIMVLDSYQMDSFQEIINRTPEYRKKLEGFTFFRNAVSGYPFTDLNIPLILTGKYYENGQPVEEFKAQAFQAPDSMMVKLKEHGYRIQMYPRVKKTFFYDSDLIDSVKPYKPGDAKGEISGLYKITMFAFLPQEGKKLLANQMTWIGDTSYGSDPASAGSGLFSAQQRSRVKEIAFVDDMLGQTRMVDQPGLFFYHFMLPHWPLRINMDLEYEKMVINRSNYLIQSEATLQLVTMMMDKLKDMHVYQQSMIVIVGDHGAGFQEQSFKMQSGMPEPTDSPVSTSLNAAAMPLILVKPPGASGSLQISDAPVTLADISDTVLKELLPDDNSLVSMFDVYTESERSRRFLEYSRVEYPYYGPMEEWLVNGIVWDTDAWRPGYRRYTRQGTQNTRPAQYKPGEKLMFTTAHPEVAAYKRFGWSMPEEKFTWTDGDEAALLIPVPSLKGELQLTVEAFPYLNERISTQNIEVWAGEQLAATWKLDEAKTYDLNATFDAGVISPDGWLEITFKLPDAQSPYSTAKSNDKRRLAMAVKSLIITQVSK